MNDDDGGQALGDQRYHQVVHPEYGAAGAVDRVSEVSLEVSGELADVFDRTERVVAVFSSGPTCGTSTNRKARRRRRSRRADQHRSRLTSRAHLAWRIPADIRRPGAWTVPAMPGPARRRSAVPGRRAQRPDLTIVGASAAVVLLRPAVNQAAATALALPLAELPTAGVGQVAVRGQGGAGADPGGRAVDHGGGPCGLPAMGANPVPRPLRPGPTPWRVLEQPQTIKQAIGIAA